MKVRANQKVYYGSKVHIEDDEFVLTDRKHFEPSCMIPVGWDPKAKVEPVSAVPQPHEGDGEPKDGSDAEPEKDAKEPVTAVPQRRRRRDGAE